MSNDTPAVPATADSTAPVMDTPTPPASGPSAARVFFLTVGGSVLYLLSAVCILSGVVLLLAPLYQIPDPPVARLLEKFHAVGVLHLYELMLLGCALAILYWRRATDDAVSLTVLIAAFLVASGIALDTIAVHFPLPTLLIGVGATCVAAMKLHALKRFVTGAFGPLPFAGLAIVLGWNFLTPALLGFAQAASVDRAGLTLLWFLAGFMPMAGGLMWLAHALHLPAGACAVGDPDQPFLRTSPMRWIVLAIIYAGSIAHHGALQWTFNLLSGPGDLLALMGISSLVAMEVVRSHTEVPLAGEPAWKIRASSVWMAVLGAASLPAALLAARSGAYIGWWSAPAGLVSFPPVFLGGMSAALLAIAWWRGSWGPAWLAAFYAASAAVVSSATPGSPAKPEVFLAAATLAAFIGTFAFLRNAPVMGLVAVAVLASAIPFDNTLINPVLANASVHPTFFASMVAGALTLLVYTLCPGRIAQGVAWAGAILFSIGLWHTFARAGTAWHAPVLALGSGAFALALVALVTWHARMLIPAGILAADAAWYGIQNIKLSTAWSLILLSFAVLAAGCAVSLLRGNVSHERRNHGTDSGHPENPPQGA